jgi:hypothetical protein
MFQLFAKLGSTKVSYNVIEMTKARFFERDLRQCIVLYPLEEASQVMWKKRDQGK